MTLGLGVSFLGESWTPLQLLGSTAIIISIVLLQLYVIGARSKRKNSIGTHPEDTRDEQKKSVQTRIEVVQIPTIAKVGIPIRRPDETIAY